MSTMMSLRSIALVLILIIYSHLFSSTFSSGIAMATGSFTPGIPTMAFEN